MKIIAFCQIEFRNNNALLLKLGIKKNHCHFIVEGQVQLCENKWTYYNTSNQKESFLMGCVALSSHQIVVLKNH